MGCPVLRLTDPSIPNRIANIPEVARTLCPGGEEMDFDFSDAVSHPQNVFLYDDGGCAAFIWCAPRIYECHLMFDPASRGRTALDASRRMRDFMMDGHADMLWGQPALANKQARWLIRQVGFSHAGFGEHPVIGPVEYLSCRQS